uniref:Protein phosphatase regulatory subunit ppp1r3c/d n=1 Tax=Nyssomyia neivai TaxID=330878 RepID=A0A1L8DLA1_9DIPT
MSAPEEQRENIDRPCGLLSLIPLGMSCRGRAEAFARRLQSRLRTLGVNGHDDHEETTNHTESTWNGNDNIDGVTIGEHFETTTELTIEPESPGSPAEECEYTQLIETTSTTPQPVESGFVCASPLSPGESVSSYSSSDGTFFDPDSDYFDCTDSSQRDSCEKTNCFTESTPPVLNGHETDSLSDSLPPSQTDDSNSTLTGCPTSTSNSTLQEVLDVLEEEPPETTNGMDFGKETSPDERPQRIQRSSSLKSGKTPPGTPGMKKFVRFADVLGLDLADVRTFLDDVPRIPTSAFDDLDVGAGEVAISLGAAIDKVLVPLFQQPSSLPKFLDLVRAHNVFLENAAVTDATTLTITGCVRVRNLDFHKSVHVRYSTDSWRSYADLQANYVENSCDGFSDKFTFILFGNALQVGQRMELAIRFQCNGQQFWDNNYGSNYCFQCLPATTKTTKAPKRESEQDEAWSVSFY